MTDVRRRRPEKAAAKRRRSASSSNSSNKEANAWIYTNKTTLFAVVFAVVAFIFYYFYALNPSFFSSQSDVVLKQSELPKALVDDVYNETSWGTHRPHLYFGLRTKHPQSPLFGLMWYRQPQEQVIYELPIRHWCEHGDDVKFSWLAHDGRTFGRQQIVDKTLELQTDWMAVGKRSWTARASGTSANGSYALVFYMATQDRSTRLTPTSQESEPNVYSFLMGSSPQLGQFFMQIQQKAQQNQLVGSPSAISYSIQPGLNLRQLNELVLASLSRPPDGQLQLVMRQNERIPGGLETNGANFVAVQFTVEGQFDFLLDFMADEPEQVERVPNFELDFSRKMAEFNGKFAEAFPIDNEGEKAHEQMAKTAVASLLGGIGVWHGHVLARMGEEAVVEYGPLSLLSAVPSRPFFPRGFLWDEGFHNLLIRQIDPELSLQIIASWLDTLSSQGWIPREVILGDEAQAKVPAEFLVQSPAVANPPMFFYVLEKFLRSPEQLKVHFSRISGLYPRLKQFYVWLRHTQRGPRPGTMQWHGRNHTTERELNPKTLPSGLDDFPRASHPSREEYHLDLRCWLALSSRVLRQLAELVGDSTWVPVVEEDVREFNDQEGLDRLHWSERRKRYADFGMHSEQVQLVQKTVVSKKGEKRGAQGQPQQPERIFVRKTTGKPQPRLVDDVFGYVNLFPFLLRLLSPDNPKLSILLRSLNQTEHLWSPYGLRSLSTRSLYYLARNTEHDPPYWRGAVWININYIALDALQHYTNSGGPNARLARDLYTELRTNVLRNVAEQYASTGFFWEHYSDTSGQGMGTRPFTGWTALVANILAENY